MNRIPDRKAKKVGEILTILLVLLSFTSMAVALDFKYPVKVERVIDGDTIVVDLSLGLGVVLDDQYIRFYGIDAWETRGEKRLGGLLRVAFYEFTLTFYRVERLTQEGLTQKRNCSIVYYII